MLQIIYTCMNAIYVYMPQKEKLLCYQTYARCATYCVLVDKLSPIFHMGLNMTKHVFWVSDKVRLKPACSATETS